jgi:hypothetical protein
MARRGVTKLSVPIPPPNDRNSVWMEGPKSLTPNPYPFDGSK